MKKIYPLILTLLLLSCSSEDVKIEEKDHVINPTFNVEQMIGSWAYESLTIDGVEQIYPHQENCTKDLFAFYNMEGKRHDYEEMIHINDNCAASNTGLTWFVNEDQVELFFGTQLVMTFTVLSVNETEFIVETTVDTQTGNQEEVIIKATRHDPYGWFE